jgi:hypothetical protein
MHPDDPHALLTHTGKAGGGGNNAAARRFQRGGGFLFFGQISVISMLYLISEVGMFSPITAIEK